ncbi:putative tyrosine--tRNA ligase, cytoplasmic, partial [Cucumispora dikerogammari]
RKIFTYARGYLGRIGFKPRVHLMNPIIQSLTAAACGNNNAPTNVDLESKPKPINKMSASDINSKIDLLDSPSQVKRKVNKAYQEEKNPNSGLMEVLNLILFPVCKIQNIPIIFNINNTLKEYKEYKEVEEALTRGELHPGDLKQGIITALNKILDLVRVGMLGSEDLIKAAYK